MGDPGGGAVRLLPAALKGGPAGEAREVSLMIIDGNRNGRLVPFTHAGHVEALGGEGACVQCHHENMPFDENTSCFECHRDMYEPTDIFDHQGHIEYLDGNAGCAKCHADTVRSKTRATAAPCADCHDDMRVAGSFINTAPVEMDGRASGYMKAMHGLCVGCHEKLVADEPEHYQPEFAQCEACHAALDAIDLRRIGPYAPQPVSANPGAMAGHKRREGLAAATAPKQGGGK